MRPPIRLAALMELPIFHIFTHDSIGVGEDGPTHQPVEQLLSLRCIPGLVTLRPADANEVAEAYRVIFSLEEPAGGAGPRRASRCRPSTATKYGAGLRHRQGRLRAGRQRGHAAR